MQAVSVAELLVSSSCLHAIRMTQKDLKGRMQNRTVKLRKLKKNLVK